MIYEKEPTLQHAIDLLYGDSRSLLTDHCTECGKLNEPDYSIQKRDYIIARYTCSSCNHKYQTYYAKD